MYEDEELYEGYNEDSSTEEIKGITNKVTEYTYTGLTYPCIVFKDGMKLEKHKIQVISNMVKSNSSALVKDISLYFNNGDQLYKLGMISGVQVISLIDIANRDNLIAFLDADTELKDSLIYTLCSI